MAWIPRDTEWFVAELVQEIQIGEIEPNELHLILVLLKASDPEIAFEKALLWGGEHNISYQNSNGELVTIRYLGLSSRNVVYEPLTDGAELLDTVVGDSSSQRLASLLIPKMQLGAFAPIDQVSWPPELTSTP